MYTYTVTVLAVADDDSRTELGTVQVKAASAAAARRLALDKLWDDRLTAASCSAAFEVAKKSTR